jgi:hypothetical protein
LNTANHAASAHSRPRKNAPRAFRCVSGTVSHLRGRATFTGECLGIQPNGKVVEITGISIHRIANGKLVEHWANFDSLSFMQQLGVVPVPEAQAAIH